MNRRVLQRRAITRQLLKDIAYLQRCQLNSLSNQSSLYTQRASRKDELILGKQMLYVHTIFSWIFCDVKGQTQFDY